MREIRNSEISKKPKAHVEQRAKTGQNKISEKPKSHVEQQAKTGQKNISKKINERKIQQEKTNQNKISEEPKDREKKQEKTIQKNISENPKAYEIQRVNFNQPENLNKQVLKNNYTKLKNMGSSELYDYVNSLLDWMAIEMCGELRNMENLDKGKSVEKVENNPNDQSSQIIKEKGKKRPKIEKKSEDAAVKELPENAKKLLKDFMLELKKQKQKKSNKSGFDYEKNIEPNEIMLKKLSEILRKIVNIDSYDRLNFSLTQAIQIMKVLIACTKICPITPNTLDYVKTVTNLLYIVYILDKNNNIKENESILSENFATVNRFLDELRNQLKDPDLYKEFELNFSPLLILCSMIEAYVVDHYQLNEINDTVNRMLADEQTSVKDKRETYQKGIEEDFGEIIGETITEKLKNTIDSLSSYIEELHNNNLSGNPAIGQVENFFNELKANIADQNGFLHYMTSKTGGLESIKKVIDNAELVKFAINTKLEELDDNIARQEQIYEGTKKDAMLIENARNDFEGLFSAVKRNSDYLDYDIIDDLNIIYELESTQEKIQEQIDKDAKETEEKFRKSDELKEKWLNELNNLMRLSIGERDKLQNQIMELVDYAKKKDVEFENTKLMMQELEEIYKSGKMYFQEYGKKKSIAQNKLKRMEQDIQGDLMKIETLKENIKSIEIGTQKIRDKVDEKIEKQRNRNKKLREELYKRREEKIKELENIEKIKSERFQSAQITINKFGPKFQVGFPKNFQGENFSVYDFYKECRKYGKIGRSDENMDKFRDLSISSIDMKMALASLKKEKEELNNFKYKIESNQNNLKKFWEKYSGLKKNGELFVNELKVSENKRHKYYTRVDEREGLFGASEIRTKALIEYMRSVYKPLLLRMYGNKNYDQKTDSFDIISFLKARRTLQNKDLFDLVISSLQKYRGQHNEQELQKRQEDFEKYMANKGDIPAYIYKDSYFPSDYRELMSNIYMYSYIENANLLKKLKKFFPINFEELTDRDFFIEIKKTLLYYQIVMANNIQISIHNLMSLFEVPLYNLEKLNLSMLEKHKEKITKLQNKITDYENTFFDSLIKIFKTCYDTFVVIKDIVYNTKTKDFGNGLGEFIGKLDGMMTKLYSENYRKLFEIYDLNKSLWHDIEKKEKIHIEEEEENEDLYGSLIGLDEDRENIRKKDMGKKDPYDYVKKHVVDNPIILQKNLKDRLKKLGNPAAVLQERLQKNKQYRDLKTKVREAKLNSLSQIYAKKMQEIEKQEKDQIDKEIFITKQDLKRLRDEYTESTDFIIYEALMGQEPNNDDDGDQQPKNEGNEGDENIVLKIEVAQEEPEPEDLYEKANSKFAIPGNEIQMGISGKKYAFAPKEFKTAGANLKNKNIDLEEVSKNKNKIFNINNPYIPFNYIQAPEFMYDINYDYKNNPYMQIDYKRENKPKIVKNLFDKDRRQKNLNVKDWEVLKQHNKNKKLRKINIEEEEEEEEDDKEIPSIKDKNRKKGQGASKNIGNKRNGNSISLNKIYNSSGAESDEENDEPEKKNKGKGNEKGNEKKNLKKKFNLINLRSEKPGSENADPQKKDKGKSNIISKRITLPNKDINKYSNSEKKNLKNPNKEENLKKLVEKKEIKFSDDIEDEIVAQGLFLDKDGNIVDKMKRIIIKKDNIKSLSKKNEIFQVNSVVDKGEHHHYEPGTFYNLTSTDRIEDIVEAEEGGLYASGLIEIDDLGNIWAVNLNGSFLIYEDNEIFYNQYNGKCYTRKGIKLIGDPNEGRIQKAPRYYARPFVRTNINIPMFNTDLDCIRDLETLYLSEEARKNLARLYYDKDNGNLLNIFGDVMYEKEDIVGEIVEGRARVKVPVSTEPSKFMELEVTVETTDNGEILDIATMWQIINNSSTDLDFKDDSNIIEYPSPKIVGECESIDLVKGYKFLELNSGIIYLFDENFENLIFLHENTILENSRLLECYKKLIGMPETSAVWRNRIYKEGIFEKNGNLVLKTGEKIKDLGFKFATHLDNEANVEYVIEYPTGSIITIKENELENLDAKFDEEKVNETLYIDKNDDLYTSDKKLYCTEDNIYHNSKTGQYFVYEDGAFKYLCEENQIRQFSDIDKLSKDGNKPEEEEISLKKKKEKKIDLENEDSDNEGNQEKDENENEKEENIQYRIVKLAPEYKEDFEKIISRENIYMSQGNIVDILGRQIIPSDDLMSINKDKRTFTVKNPIKAGAFEFKSKRPYQYSMDLIERQKYDALSVEDKGGLVISASGHLFNKNDYSLHTNKSSLFINPKTSDVYSHYESEEKYKFKDEPEKYKPEYDRIFYIGSTSNYEGVPKFIERAPEYFDRVIRQCPGVPLTEDRLKDYGYELTPEEGANLKKLYLNVDCDVIRNIFGDVIYKAEDFKVDQNSKVVTSTEGNNKVIDVAKTEEGEFIYYDDLFSFENQYADELDINENYQIIFTDGKNKEYPVDLYQNLKIFTPSDDGGYISLYYNNFKSRLVLTPSRIKKESPLQKYSKEILEYPLHDFAKNEFLYEDGVYALNGGYVFKTGLTLDDMHVEGMNIDENLELYTNDHRIYYYPKADVKNWKETLEKEKKDGKFYIDEDGALVKIASEEGKGDEVVCTRDNLVINYDEKKCFQFIPDSGFKFICDTSSVTLLKNDPPIAQNEENNNGGKIFEEKREDEKEKKKNNEEEQKFIPNIEEKIEKEGLFLDDYGNYVDKMDRKKHYKEDLIVEQTGEIYEKTKEGKKGDIIFTAEEAKNVRTLTIVEDDERKSQGIDYELFEDEIGNLYNKNYELKFSATNIFRNPKTGKVYDRNSLKYIADIKDIKKAPLYLTRLVKTDKENGVTNQAKSLGIPIDLISLKNDIYRGEDNKIYNVYDEEMFKDYEEMLKYKIKFNDEDKEVVVDDGKGNNKRIKLLIDYGLNGKVRAEAKKNATRIVNYDEATTKLEYKDEHNITNTISLCKALKVLKENGDIYIYDSYNNDLLLIFTQEELNNLQDIKQYFECLKVMPQYSVHWRRLLFNSGVFFNANNDLCLRTGEELNSYIGGIKYEQNAQNAQNVGVSLTFNTDGIISKDYPYDNIKKYTDMNESEKLKHKGKKIIESDKLFIKDENGFVEEYDVGDLYKNEATGDYFAAVDGKIEFLCNDLEIEKKKNELNENVEKKKIIPEEEDQKKPNKEEELKKLVEKKEIKFSKDIEDEILKQGLFLNKDGNIVDKMQRIVIRKDNILSTDLKNKYFQVKFLVNKGYHHYEPGTFYQLASTDYIEDIVEAEEKAFLEIVGIKIDDLGNIWSMKPDGSHLIYEDNEIFYNQYNGKCYTRKGIKFIGDPNEGKIKRAPRHYARPFVREKYNDELFDMDLESIRELYDTYFSEEAKKNLDRLYYSVSSSGLCNIFGSEIYPKEYIVGAITDGKARLKIPFPNDPNKFEEKEVTVETTENGAVLFFETIWNKAEELSKDLDLTNYNSSIFVTCPSPEEEGKRIIYIDLMKSYKFLDLENGEILLYDEDLTKFIKLREDTIKKNSKLLEYYKKLRNMPETSAVWRNRIFKEGIFKKNDELNGELVLKTGEEITNSGFEIKQYIADEGGVKYKIEYPTGSIITIKENELQNLDETFKKEKVNKPLYLDKNGNLYTSEKELYCNEDDVYHDSKNGNYFVYKDGAFKYICNKNEIHPFSDIENLPENEGNQEEEKNGDEEGENNPYRVIDLTLNYNNDFEYIIFSEGFYIDQGNIVDILGRKLIPSEELTNVNKEEKTFQVKKTIKVGILEFDPNDTYDYAQSLIERQRNDLPVVKDDGGLLISASGHIFKKADKSFIFDKSDLIINPETSAVYIYLKINDEGQEEPEANQEGPKERLIYVGSTMKYDGVPRYIEKAPEYFDRPIRQYPGIAFTKDKLEIYGYKLTAKEETNLNKLYLTRDFSAIKNLFGDVIYRAEDFKVDEHMRSVKSTNSTSFKSKSSKSNNEVIDVEKTKKGRFIFYDDLFSFEDQYAKDLEITANAQIKFPDGKGNTCYVDLYQNLKIMTPSGDIALYCNDFTSRLILNPAKINEESMLHINRSEMAAYPSCDFTKNEFIYKGGLYNFNGQCVFKTGLTMEDMQVAWQDYDDDTLELITSDHRKFHCRKANIENWEDALEAEKEDGKFYINESGTLFKDISENVNDDKAVCLEDDLVINYDKGKCFQFIRDQGFKFICDLSSVTLLKNGYPLGRNEEKKEEGENIQYKVVKLAPEYKEDFEKLIFSEGYYIGQRNIVDILGREIIPPEELTNIDEGEKTFQVKSHIKAGYLTFKPNEEYPYMESLIERQKEDATSVVKDDGGLLISASGHLFNKENYSLHTDKSDLIINPKTSNVYLHYKPDRKYRFKGKPDPDRIVYVGTTSEYDKAPRFIEKAPEYFDRPIRQYPGFSINKNILVAYGYNLTPEAEANLNKMYLTRDCRKITNLFGDVIYGEKDFKVDDQLKLVTSTQEKKEAIKVETTKEGDFIYYDDLFSYEDQYANEMDIDVEHLQIIFTDGEGKKNTVNLYQNLKILTPSDDGGYISLYYNNFKSRLVLTPSRIKKESPLQKYSKEILDYPLYDFAKNEFLYINGLYYLDGKVVFKTGLNLEDVQADLINDDPETIKICTSDHRILQCPEADVEVWEDALEAEKEDGKFYINESGSLFKDISENVNDDKAVCLEDDLVINYDKGKCFQFIPDQGFEFICDLSSVTLLKGGNPLAKNEEKKEEEKKEEKKEEEKKEEKKEEEKKEEKKEEEKKEEEKKEEEKKEDEKVEKKNNGEEQKFIPTIEDKVEERGLFLDDDDDYVDKMGRKKYYKKDLIKKQNGEIHKKTKEGKEGDLLFTAEAAKEVKNLSDVEALEGAETNYELFEDEFGNLYNNDYEMKFSVNNIFRNPKTGKVYDRNSLKYIARIEDIKKAPLYITRLIKTDKENGFTSQAKSLGIPLDKILLEEQIYKGEDNKIYNIFDEEMFKGYEIEFRDNNEVVAKDAEGIVRSRALLKGDYALNGKVRAEAKKNVTQIQNYNEFTTKLEYRDENNKTNTIHLCETYKVLKENGDIYIYFDYDRLVLIFTQEELNELPEIEQYFENLKQMPQNSVHWKRLIFNSGVFFNANNDLCFRTGESIDSYMGGIDCQQNNQDATVSLIFNTDGIISKDYLYDGTIKKYTDMNEADKVKHKGKKIIESDKLIITAEDGKVDKYEVRDLYKNEKTEDYFAEVDGKIEFLCNDSDIEKKKTELNENVEKEEKLIPELEPKVEKKNNGEEQKFISTIEKKIEEKGLFLDDDDDYVDKMGRKKYYKKDLTKEQNGDIHEKTKNGQKGKLILTAEEAKNIKKLSDVEAREGEERNYELFEDEIGNLYTFYNNKYGTLFYVCELFRNPKTGKVYDRNTLKYIAKIEDIKKAPLYLTRLVKTDKENGVTSQAESLGIPLDKIKLEGKIYRGENNKIYNLYDEEMFKGCKIEFFEGGQEIVVKDGKGPDKKLYLKGEYAPKGEVRTEAKGNATRIQNYEKASTKLEYLDKEGDPYTIYLNEALKVLKENGDIYIYEDLYNLELIFTQEELSKLQEIKQYFENLKQMPQNSIHWKRLLFNSGLFFGTNAVLCFRTGESIDSYWGGIDCQQNAQNASVSLIFDTDGIISEGRMYNDMKKYADMNETEKLKHKGKKIIESDKLIITAEDGKVDKYEVRDLYKNETTGDYFAEVDGKIEFLCNDSEIEKKKNELNENVEKEIKLTPELETEIEKSGIFRNSNGEIVDKIGRKKRDYKVDPNTGLILDKNNNHIGQNLKFTELPLWDDDYLLRKDDKQAKEYHRDKFGNLYYKNHLLSELRARYFKNKKTGILYSTGDLSSIAVENQIEKAPKFYDEIIKREAGKKVVEQLVASGLDINNEGIKEALKQIYKTKSGNIVNIFGDIVYENGSYDFVKNSDKKIRLKDPNHPEEMKIAGDYDELRKIAKERNENIKGFDRFLMRILLSYKVLDRIEDLEVNIPLIKIEDKDGNIEFYDFKKIGIPIELDYIIPAGGPSKLSQKDLLEYKKYIGALKNKEQNIDLFLEAVLSEGIFVNSKGEKVFKNGFTIKEMPLFQPLVQSVSDEGNIIRVVMKYGEVLEYDAKSIKDLNTVLDEEVKQSKINSKGYSIDNKTKDLIKTTEDGEITVSLSGNYFFTRNSSGDCYGISESDGRFKYLCNMRDDLGVQF